MRHGNGKEDEGRRGNEIATPDAVPTRPSCRARSNSTRLLMPLRPRLDRLAKLRIGVFTGAEERVTRRLVSHGLIWLLVTSLLDLTTSWIMMALRGSSAEAYAPQRQLFDHPSLATLDGLLRGQSAYFELAALGIAALVSLYLRRSWLSGRKQAVAAELSMALCPISIFSSWLVSIYRFTQGVGSNVIGILVKADPWVQVAALLVLVLGGAAIIARDLFRSIPPLRGPASSAPVRTSKEN